MENQVFQKTPFARLLIGAVLGLGTSIAPLVLLGFGLAQFNIIRLVGVQSATAVYGMVGGIAGIAIVIMSPLGGVINAYIYLCTFNTGAYRWILPG